MSIKTGELGGLLVLPHIAPQALPIVGGELREEQRRWFADRLPRAAVTAPAAIAVEGVGGVTAARADLLELVRKVPGAVLNARRHCESVSECIALKLTSS